MGHTAVLGLFLSGASELATFAYTLHLPSSLREPRRFRVTARATASRTWGGVGFHPSQLLRQRPCAAARSWATPPPRDGPSRREASGRCGRWFLRWSSGRACRCMPASASTSGLRGVPHDHAAGGIRAAGDQRAGAVEQRLPGRRAQQHVVDAGLEVPGTAAGWPHGDDRNRPGVVGGGRVAPICESGLFPVCPPW